MKENSGWLVQFGSEDDCYIPINETREIKDQLKLPKECYYEFSKEEKKSHFSSKSFPELFEGVVEKINADFSI